MNKSSNLEFKDSENRSFCVYYGDFVNEIKAASFEEFLETVKLKYLIETNSEIKLTFWSEKHQEWIQFKDDLPDDLSKIKILTESK